MERLYDRKKRDVTRLGFVLLLILLSLFRLLLAMQGRLFLEPENSPIDDHMMYEAAVNITEGNWLGTYDYNTIGKHMFFSVWLAFIHWLGVPYLVANAALSSFSAWAMASALAPVVKKKCGVLSVFFVLAYCPVNFDQYNYRVYRDSVTVALMLLAFGGVIGCVLRAFPVENEQGREKRRRCIAFLGYAIIGGLGLGASWLNREDGVWLLPFVVCFLLLGALALIKSQGFCKSASKLLVFCVPFLLLLGSLAAYAGVNLKYYNRFIISDLTSDDFTSAYGLLVGIEDENTGRYRPITYKTRKLLYENSELFAGLEQYWDSPHALNGYGDPMTHEFGGSYYYALRLASSFAGQYEDPLETKRYYESVAAELLRLEQEGYISIPHKSNLTVPYWRWEYLGPTIKELGNGLYMSIFCSSFDPEPKLSIYSKEDLVAEILDYLNGEIVRGYRLNSDRLYYNILQEVSFLGEKILCWIWRILIVPALGCGLWFAFAYWKKGFQFLFSKEKKVTPEFFVWILLWGLLLSAILRCAIMAYMEVTIFGIGTYLMYQAAAVPLLGLFGILGVNEAIRKAAVYKGGVDSGNKIE